MYAASEKCSTELRIEQNFFDRLMSATKGLSMKIDADKNSASVKATISRVSEKSDSLSESKTVLVVGIGASAGGVEALSRFFDAMPPDSGAAFVIFAARMPARVRVWC